MTLRIDRTLKEVLKSPTSFSERAYALLATVPKGRLTSYGELARALKAKAFRAVGTAMHNNPYAPQIPCHRVVRADATLGGFAKGTAAKKKLLLSEGIQFEGSRIKNFEKVFYRF